jgi:hypothetical protein
MKPRRLTVEASLFLSRPVMNKKMWILIGLWAVILIELAWLVFDPFRDEEEWVTVVRSYADVGKNIIKTKTRERGWIDVTLEVYKKLRNNPTTQYRFGKQWSILGSGPGRYSIILEERPYEGPDFDVPPEKGPTKDQTSTCPQRKRAGVDAVASGKRRMDGIGGR